MNSFDFGKVIKERRLSLNLTAEHVAQACNISRATLSSVENGSQKISLATVLDILNYLDIKVSIINREEYANKRKRATRINTTYDKKVNSFIVMCIEQYALKMKQTSQEVYKNFKKIGY